MKARFVVCTSLLALAACSSSGDGDGTGAAGGQSSGGTSANAGAGGNTLTGGTANGSAGANAGTANNGGGGQGNGGNGNVAGSGGVGTGGVSNGGTGGVSNGGTGGGAGGTISIPTTCTMPVVNATPGNACPGAAPPALALTQITTDDDLNAPLMLASPPGDNSRLFVITRDGLVHIIKDGTLLPTPFVDISDVVLPSQGEDEYGLLGMAFDPAFATNGKLWLHYCGDTTVNNSYCQSVTASVTVSAADPDVADRASLTPIFSVDQPNNNNHKGGMIAFGTDGCLYVSFGDGGSQGDPNGNGQDTGEPMASIQRIDPATGAAAPGNPGYGDARTWNYGLRNPWRFSFDRATGDMYIGDVGQGMWEEVDIAPAGVGDFNFGWNVMEGPDGDATGKRSPAFSHPREESTSVTGGYVYRGTAIPGMVGRYVYGDFKSNRYWVLTYSGEAAGQPTICDKYEITTDLDDANGPAAFGEDANGEIYVITLGGAIYRIDAGP